MSGSDTFIGTVVVVAAFLLVVWAWLSDEVQQSLEPAVTPVSYEEQCIESTIRWSGLRACYDDSGCSLGDDEMYGLYMANKTSLIVCARFEAEKTLRELQKQKNDYDPSKLKPGHPEADIRASL